MEAVDGGILTIKHIILKQLSMLPPPEFIRGLEANLNRNFAPIVGEFDY